jgi:hypothetical protein
MLNASRAVNGYDDDDVELFNSTHHTLPVLGGFNPLLEGLIVLHGHGILILP